MMLRATVAASLSRVGSYMLRRHDPTRIGVQK
jgi:hypothetical protein